ncbi:glycosyltransferase [Nostoc punctiforme]|uniref:Glycosyl transferase, group 1 n=1 Tax=Nostoc punctiforme (strain ATCC 29133 / PCC 73102) TaxID=63737 RepID=B2J024_NOSP7|nr:glycosyltransferase [Nostoc punctiforme]ACC81795.1 glycosyl transferase, group 1 [Nostoc punctiforme PCC 73102]
MSSHPSHTLLFLFTTFLPEVTGSAIFNWERVQWFAKQGIYRIIVLAPDWQEQSKLPVVPPDLAENLILETYPSQPWLLYPLLHVPKFSTARYINQRIAHYKPDLINVVDVERLFLFSTWHLPGRRYAKNNKILYITEYHTDYCNHVSTYPAGNLLREILWKPITKYLYNKCDITIAISPTASKILQKMGISNAITIPMYGLDLSAYTPSRRNRQFLETWLTPQEKDNKVILFLGRIALEKRIDILIKAFSTLQLKQKNSSLIIAGDGPVEVVQKLKNLAKSIPNIHFIGFVHGEKKANLLAASDIYCSPAPYETFGRTLVEAMASGTPAITVNSGGVSDYILDGINGYLVEPNDVEALTHAILKILRNENRNVIQRACEDAKQFSLEQACENLHNYYQEILNKN